jgi:hypothetical protein
MNRLPFDDVRIIEKSATLTGRLISCCSRIRVPRCGLSVKVIEDALVLAATCRLIRPADTPPLGTIRSRAYFLPVIEEVLVLRASPGTSTISATNSHAPAPAARFAYAAPWGRMIAKGTRTPTAWMISPLPPTTNKPYTLSAWMMPRS